MGEFVFQKVCECEHVHVWFCEEEGLHGSLGCVAGRQTANDIAAFAKDSAKNRVIVLGPQDFPDPVVDSMQPWVVDFYAPVNSALRLSVCLLLPFSRPPDLQSGRRIQYLAGGCVIRDRETTLPPAALPLFPPLPSTALSHTLKPHS